jgi:hypothetical protein
MWSEPNPEPGQPAIELEIVCEVHKEAPGWRISGLAVKMSGTEETLVLDFENATSLQQALEQAGGDPNRTPAQPSSPPTIAVGEPYPQAGQLPGAIEPPQGLKPAQADALALPSGSPPALPALDSQPSFAPQQPTQIALPPSGTINR